MAEEPIKYKTCPHCAEEIRAEAKVCRFCGKKLTTNTEFGCGKAIGFSVLAVVVVFGCSFLVWIFGDTSGNSRSRSPTHEFGQPAWISGIDDCPTSFEFGDLVAPNATFFRSINADFTDTFTPIAHRTKVERLTSLNRQGLVKVRYGGNVGYVQGILLVSYDPGGGVKPDQQSCS